MKKWIGLMGSLGLLLMVTAVWAGAPLTVKVTGGSAKITLLRGTAQVVCPGQKEARILKTNDVIQTGCVVSTGAASRLELALPDRSVVRFAEKTKFTLISADISEDGKRSVGISVGVGKAWMKVRKSLKEGDGKFEVSCQNAVAGVRGTVYRLDVESDQSALVKVYEGEVSVAASPKPRPEPGLDHDMVPPRPVPGPTSVSGPASVSMGEWTFLVKTMQQISINSDGKAAAPEAFSPSEDMDEWVRWNKKRDRGNRF